MVQDWLSLGEVSFLKGEHEVGKSLLAQQLMTSVATHCSIWMSNRLKHMVYFVRAVNEI
ncbi:MULTISPECIES: AAA family ATPase [unclassified Wolbachia]|uniref:AAA family ATPase n=1 Tax=unclassified Wolbachia TaxID=2640676 RepID=UPI00333E9226